MQSAEKRPPTKNIKRTAVRSEEQIIFKSTTTKSTRKILLCRTSSKTPCLFHRFDITKKKRRTIIKEAATG